MNEIRYGLLHNHTTHSIKDSVVTVKDLVAKAKSYGAPAVALTDHGAMTGCYEFYNECLANNIKPVLGCELYVKDHSFGSRLHLIIMAKDYVGYQALMKCVKLSNKRIQKVGTLIFPESNTEILEKCFGKESTGYGHVIATSACINGVIAGLAFQNETLSEKYSQNLEKIQKDENVRNTINQINNMISSYEKVISDGSDEKAVKESKEKIKTLKKGLTSQKKSLLDEAIKLQLKKDNEKLEILYRNNRDELVSFMEEETLRYENIFGKGNFFIEIQNHGMREEKEWMYQMDLIAQKLGIPTCAANDAHMLDGSDESVLARQTITGLRWNNITPVEASEKECYVKTDEELCKMISAVVGPKRAELAMEGIKTIVDACDIKLPEKPMHYPVFRKGEDSFSLLVEEVKKGIKRRFPNDDMPQEYKDRINYELKIMKQMKVADYILIVQDLLSFGRKLGNMPEERFAYLQEHIWEMTYDEAVEYVDADQSYFGYTVGPGRGSSAGSLVCYIIGITDLDPMPYGLLFERFLNPERVSMPDIDSDYGTGYRDVVIAYTYKKYGEDAVCRIITYGTHSAKAAIKAVARAIGRTKAIGADEGTSELKEFNALDCQDSRSVILPVLKSQQIIKHYQDLGDKLAKVCSGKPHDVLANYDEQWATMDDESKEVIKRAKSIEGSYSQYGMHACGVIISDNDNVNEYVPLSWDDKNNCFKTQCVPAEAEDQGLLKMDYLGLKNLNMITEMVRLIYKNHGIKINPTLIPVEKEVIENICKNGSTNGVFQLESSGMKDICKKMKPDCFEDLILLVAAYRPGPMDSIPEIIAVKTGQKQASYSIPELESILNVTYSKPIYQEQVQQIFRELAGYSYGQADNVRRAMAKKKEKVLLAERDAFVHGDASRNIEGCENRGINPVEADKLFDEMISFASYAFNKSHAAVYARIAYILMYLKYHYFAEFMTVTLKWASDKRIMALIQECRENNVEVLPPDINKSEEDFTTCDNKILYGLSSIKGIVSVDKILEARKEAPFKDFKDFIRRGHFKKNVTEALIWAGAFDEISSSRKAIYLMLEELCDASEGINDKEQKIETTDELIRFLNSDPVMKADKTAILSELNSRFGLKVKTVPKIEKKMKDIEKYRLELDALKETYEIIEEPTMFKDDKEYNLKKEKELLGVYISGHPTDSYVVPDNCLEIASIEKEGKALHIFGAIANLVNKQRKSDGAGMAFFELEDKTGSIDVQCFTKPFKQYSALLKEGAVIEIVGNANISTNITGTDENGEDIVETEIKFSVSNIYPAEKKSRTLMLSIDDLSKWPITLEALKPYITNDEGCSLQVWVRQENTIRQATFRVMDSILLNNDFVIADV